MIFISKTTVMINFAIIRTAAFVILALAITLGAWEITDLIKKNHAENRTTDQ